MARGRSAFAFLAIRSWSTVGDARRPVERTRLAVVLDRGSRNWICSTGGLGRRNQDMSRAAPPAGCSHRFLLLNLASAYRSLLAGTLRRGGYCVFIFRQTWRATGACAIPKM